MLLVLFKMTFKRGNGWLKMFKYSLICKARPTLKETLLDGVEPGVFVRAETGSMIEVN